MVKTLSWVSLAALGLLVAPLAKASTTTPLVSQEQYTVGQGDLETTFGFNPDILIGGGQTAHDIELTMGANYFVTDMFAPGVEFMYEHVTGVGSGARFLPNLKAYWPLNQRILPFAQIGFGYAHVPGQDNFDFRIGPGVDFMLSNTVAIGFAFKYDLLVGSQTLHELNFPIDFAIYFKL